MSKYKLSSAWRAAEHCVPEIHLAPAPRCSLQPSGQEGRASEWRPWCFDSLIDVLNLGLFVASNLSELKRLAARQRDDAWEGRWPDRIHPSCFSFFRPATPPSSSPPPLFNLDSLIQLRLKFSLPFFFRLSAGHALPPPLFPEMDRNH